MAKRAGFLAYGTSDPWPSKCLAGGAVGTSDYDANREPNRP